VFWYCAISSACLQGVAAGRGRVLPLAGLLTDIADSW